MKTNIVHRIGTHRGHGVAARLGCGGALLAAGLALAGCGGENIAGSVAPQPEVRSILPDTPIPFVPDRFGDGADLATDDGTPLFPGGRFDLNAFDEAIARHSGSGDVRTLAMPRIPVAHVGEANSAVRALVALTAGVAPEAVGVDVLPCGDDGARCANGFIYAVNSESGALAAELTPLARSVERAADGVRAVVWTPTRSGEALPAVTTIYGRHNKHLVGITVFRGSGER